MAQNESRIVNVLFDDIVHETCDAVLFYFKDEQEVDLPDNELWLPRSKIKYDETTRQIFLPEDLAREKGLI